MDYKENLETLFEKLERFFRTETVVGKPLTVGDVTLVPIIEVTFGLGTGGGSGKDSKGNDGTGGGAGVGGKIAPNSVLVIKGDEVTLMALKDKGSLERIIDMVPEIISKVKADKEE
ncbi:MAG: spore germination protein GerW family protein [Peptococcaceae bacterium]|jgi:uncharacterized spore protein YtfJ|nr:spore germination protein GerW family protein [Peptococcaceae bacterium]MDH7525864.1 spore germination protein GerW family protein [Peptococcaceae bacterium]